MIFDQDTYSSLGLEYFRLKVFWSWKISGLKPFGENNGRISVHILMRFSERAGGVPEVR